MPATVRELNQHFIDLWWESASDLPDLGPLYTPGEQTEREKQLEQLLKAVNAELTHPPRNQEEAQALQERLEALFLPFAQAVFGLTSEHLSALPVQEFSDAAQEFVRMARDFDPTLKGEDIYQAGRNAWTANGLQWLLGVPVQITPSIFAYSMLYPYTDNYLDDASLSTTAKLAFNRRFRQRLAGEMLGAANPHEQIIFNLIAMIEGEYVRSSFPQVFESLLEIHAAQGKSLRLMRPNAAPGEVDVLGISFEKGGTSVTADGYLAAGSLSAARRQFSYGHGIFAQLLDDLEDIADDYQAGRLTIYSQAAGHWKLDALTNRTFHFGQKVLEGLNHFDISQSLHELIRRGANSMLIDAISRSERFYSPGYLRELEQHSPFRFNFLARQRKEFARKHGSVVKLIETFAPQSLLQTAMLP